MMGSSRTSLVFAVGLLLLVVILWTNSSPQVDVIVEGNQRHDVGFSPFVKHFLSYTPHDPIIITGDEEFHNMAQTEGWIGDGTNETPYIITDLNITSEYQSFTITNTSVHFVIKDCLLRRITFTNVTNSRIEGSEIRFPIGSGGTLIELSDSFNITIIHNAIEHAATCVKVVYSESITIIDNNISYYRDYGARIEQSECNITKNHFTGLYNLNCFGIYNDHSDGLNIINENLFEQSYQGILSYSPCEISNNVLNGSLRAYGRDHDADGGIKVSWNSIVYNNSIVKYEFGLNQVGAIPQHGPFNATSNRISHSKWGIYVHGCANVTLFNNTISNCTEYTVMVENSKVVNVLSNNLYNGSFHIGNSDDTVLMNNIMDLVHFSAQSSNDVLLEKNLLMASIDIQFCTGLNISSNDALNTIDISSSDWSTIESNQINYSVSLLDSDYCRFFNNTLNTIDTQFYSLRLENSDHSNVSNNTFASWKLELVNSINATIEYNNFTYGGLEIKGNNIMYWDHHVTNNTVNDKKLGVLHSLENQQVDAGVFGQLILLNCSNVVTANGSMRDVIRGVTLAFSVNCTVYNSSVEQSFFQSWGFYVWYSQECVLSTNTIIGAYHAIEIQYSDNCIFMANFVNESSTGFYVYSSDLLVITNNSLFYTENIALRIDTCSFCSIYYNTIAWSVGIGSMAWDSTGMNDWDDGSLGNFWSDYSGSGPYDVGNTYDFHPVLYEISPPTIDEPNDIVYEAGITGNIIEWTPFDDNPISYVLILNGTEVESGGWNGSSFAFAVDGLTLGTHNFTLRVYDRYGLYNSDTVFVEVVDTTSPATDNPPDFSIAENSSAVLQWNPSDEYPSHYSVLKNGTEVEFGPWNGSVISVSVTGTMQVENYTLIVWDTSNNSAYDIVLVIGFDGTAPVIDGPEDMGFEAGIHIITIEWNITETHPLYMWILVNDTVTSEAVWNGSPIQYNLTDPSPYVVNVTLVVTDIGGNNVSDPVLVTISDTTSPAFVLTPNDLAYIVGQTGFIVSWTADDLYPNSYDIIRNGTSFGPNVWNGSSIQASVDETVPGLYNYTLIVFDEYGNWQYNTVLVTVNPDVYSPVLSNPEDLTINEGTSGNTISWTANDINPSHYQVFINGTANVTDTWVGTLLLISIDGLELGIYEIELHVFDLYGNSANDTVIVTVRDVTTPTISSPENVIYEYGTQGHTIEWTLYDIHPHQYWVYRNESIVQAAGWSNGDLSYSIDGLSIGKYNITLSVTDTSGNMASDTVWVTVVDVDAPEIDHPADIEFEAGSTGHTITWNPSDANPHSYEVLVNGTVNITRAWDGSGIVFSLDGFKLGIYNITVILYDSTSNSAADAVWVTVVDTTPPDIGHPPDVRFVEGEKGHSITWTTHDLHPSHYELRRNGTLVKSGLWNSSEEVITVPLDTLPLGNHSFILTLYDVIGNSISDEVTVSVVASATITTTTTTTTATTTTTTTTETTTTTTSSTTLTTPEGNELMVIAIVGGIGGVVIVIIIVIVMKKKQS